MFGFFSKSEFEVRMQNLENQKKFLIRQLLEYTDSFNLTMTAETLKEIISLLDEQISYCERYKKYEMVPTLRQQKDKFNNLLG